MRRHWRTGDIAQIISGQHVMAQDVNDVGEGTPYLTGPSDFTELGIQSSKFTTAGRAFCKAGDLLITVKGSGVGSHVVADRDYAISRQLMAIRAQEVDREFLAYAISLGAKSLAEQAKGTIPGLTRDDIAAIEIPAVSDLSEQRKIVSILTSWDQAIKTAHGLTNHYESLLDACRDQLMHQVLSGDCPVITIAESGLLYGGLAGKSAKDFGTGKKYITYRNVFENSVTSPEGVDFVNIEEHETQHCVKRGDYLFTQSSETPEEVGMCSAVMSDFGECYLNSFCFGWRPKPEVPLIGDFARHFFRSATFRRELIRLAQGATRYNLSKSEFGKLQVPLPSASHQSEIGAALSLLERSLGLYRAQTRLLVEQKNALLQQLLSGAIPVPLP